MNKTIYVKDKKLWDELAEQNNMSDLIEKLLRQYYSGNTDIKCQMKLEAIKRILEL